MIQLPQLQESLLIANERLVDRARRRARLFRTGLMTSAAVVSVGGAAAAGIALWNPPLGHEDGNRPSISASPVPSNQEDLLGVLRRPQTAADRAAVSQRALVAFSSRYRGVRLAAVRTLFRNASGASVVLLSVADLRARDNPGSTGQQDALCAYTTTGGEAARSDGLACFDTDEVRRGAVTGRAGDLLWALVPDGVATVTYHGVDGADHPVAVRDNAISLSADDVAPKRPDVTWLDGEGRQVAPSTGTPMTLSVDPQQDSTQGFHDCGRPDGVLVPDAVPCGPDAERYAPKPGDAVAPRK